MPGPWEDYAPQATKPPWEDYGGKGAMPVEFGGSTTPTQGPWNDYSKLAGGSEAKIQSAPGFLQSLVEGVTAPFNQPPVEVSPYEKRPGTLSKIGRTAMGVLGLVNAPFEAVSRGTTKYAGENLPVSPQQAEAIGQGVGAIAQNAILPWRSRVPLAPARAIEEVLPQRLALPPPTEQLALPPATQPKLPPPAADRMVMEAGPAGVQQAPKRTIVDLVDEVKRDVKDQVVSELVDELRTGRGRATAAAQPPRTAQQLIEAPRQQIEPPKNPIYEVNPQGEAAATSFRPLPREAITPTPVEQLFTQVKPEGLKAGVTKAAEPRAAALDFMNQYKASKGLTPEAGLTPPRPIEDVLPQAKPKVQLPDEPPFDVPAAEAPVDAWTAASRKLAELRDIKPRPLNKLYGANPTPEQIASSAQETKAWNSKYRAATKELDAAKTAQISTQPAQAAEVKPAGNVEANARTVSEAVKELPPTPWNKRVAKVLNEVQTAGKLFINPYKRSKDYQAALESVGKGRLTFDGAEFKAKEAPSGLWPTKQRGAADILKSEKGQINIPGRPPPLPGEPVEVGKGRLIAGGLGEESSKTLSKTMGAEGGEMARLAKAVRNDAEIEANTAKTAVNKVLKGLDKNQVDNLAAVLEGKAKPIDAKVEAAFKVARAEDDKVAARASQVKLTTTNPVTGEKYPFQRMENHFPHMFETELGDYIKDPFAKANIKGQLKAKMEAGGKEVSDKQVEQALNAMLKATRGREGHLEIARVFNRPDYSRDVGKVLNKHFTDAYRRIQIAEKFGPDLSKGEELLTTIGQNHGDRAEQFARQYFQRVTGTEPVNRLAHEAVNTAVNLNNFSLLGQAAIANASQPTYTAILAGVKNTAKGYAKALTPEGRDFASKILGTSAKEFMEDVSAAAGKSTSGKMADVVLKYTGFNAVERMNRIVSANAGRAYAEATFEKLLQNPKHAGFRETLQKMNVDVDGALKRGALSEADTLKAGQNIVNRTQFKTDVTELPLFWSSEAGRLLTQYKKFQFKSGQFVKDEIGKEILKGNILPLARAAAIAPAAGAAVLGARDAIRLGKQRDEDKGLADYLAAVGTFGAFSDAFAGSGRQPVSGLQYLAGPTLGRAGQLWEAGRAITREGDLRPLAKFAASSVPVVGPSIRQLFNKDQEKSPHTKMLEDLGIDTKRPSRAKLLEELGINR